MRQIIFVPKAGAAGALSGLAIDADKDMGGKTLSNLNLGADVTLGGSPLAQTMPIGVRWDRTATTPAQQRIDAAGNVLATLPFGSFDQHVLFGSLRRCVIDPATGEVTHGTNARGDGLDLSGASGPVMVECGRVYVKAWRAADAGAGTDYLNLVVSPTPLPGFELHPAFYQRGGEPADYVYWGAYEGSLKDDAGTLKLDSKTGVQPWTGYYDNTRDGMFALGFTGGLADQEPSVGDTVTGAGGSTGILVAYHLTSGAWATNDAAGILYLRQTSAVFVHEEALSVETVPFAAVNTAAGNAGISLTIAQAEGYANAVGEGWGITNPWTWSLRQLLMYVEYATLDVPAVLGFGVADKASGTGFAGELTGAGSIDSRLAENGTGAGNGTNGLTPICWRGTENPWANTLEGIVGWNAIDAEYRIVPRAGLPGSTIAVTLTGTEGTDYEATVAVPLTYNATTAPDGYAKTTVYEELTKYLFIPEAVGGASNTYLADYFYQHRAGQTNDLFAGGYWDDARTAGPGYLAARYAASTTARAFGARLEVHGRRTTAL